ncbi:MAG: hypothetical protein IPL61_22400 [Myxococcales bacterium]|nr:hypothetical protein [Myxococcales bacterium]
MLEPSLIAPFVARLNGLGVVYMVTGSTAGTIYGEPRLTHDVDLVVILPPRDVAAFAAAFPDDEFYCPPEDVLAIEARRGTRGHCNIIHHDTGFKADIYFASDDLHRWALAHRRTLDLDGLVVPLAPIEYVLVRKAEYFREGRSAKHVRDIRSMLELSADVVDRAVLDQWLDRLGLQATWAEIVAPAA